MSSRRPRNGLLQSRGATVKRRFNSDGTRDRTSATRSAESSANKSPGASPALANTTPNGSTAMEYPVARGAVIEPGSTLARLIGVNLDAVPISHHQAVDGLGDGLVAVAWSEDRVIEAIERPESTFTVGVQWHPEELPGEFGLFRGFIEASRGKCLSRMVPLQLVGAGGWESARFTATCFRGCSGFLACHQLCPGSYEPALHSRPCGSRTRQRRDPHSVSSGSMTATPPDSTALR